jgi:hypothetical protein
VFALITAEIEAHGDDVYAGVFAAIGWIAAQLPVYSVNFVLATATDLWALRYPVTNELWLLPRRAGGTVGHGVLHARSDSIHVGSAALADQPSVIVASGPMDDDPGWRPLSSGELIHIDAYLSTHCRIAFPEPRRTPLTLADCSRRWRCRRQRARRPPGSGRAPAWSAAIRSGRWAETSAAGVRHRFICQRNGNARTDQVLFFTTPAFGMRFRSSSAYASARSRTPAGLLPIFGAALMIA